MDNTELFLDKYKELENAAINEFKLPPDGSAVAKLEKRSEFKDIRFNLTIVERFEIFCSITNVWMRNSPCSRARR